MPIIELRNKKQIFVQENDFTNPIKWEDAINYCNNTNGNWRIPTIEELKELHYQKLIPTGDYGYWSYWSSSKVNDLVQILSDQKGNVTLASNNEECYLILVRDI